MSGVVYESVRRKTNVYRWNKMTKQLREGVLLVEEGLLVIEIRKNVEPEQVCCSKPGDGLS